jgi:hypothetical protein
MITCSPPPRATARVACSRWRTESRSDSLKRPPASLQAVRIFDVDACLHAWDGRGVSMPVSPRLIPLQASLIAVGGGTRGAHVPMSMSCRGCPPFRVCTFSDSRLRGEAGIVRSSGDPLGFGAREFMSNNFDLLRKHHCICRSNAGPRFIDDPDHLHSCEKYKNILSSPRHNNIYNISHRSYKIWRARSSSAASASRTYTVVRKACATSRRIARSTRSTPICS